MTSVRLLRFYRIAYQVLRVLTGKLKEEIEDIEKELNEPSDSAETAPNKV
jgi:hypothetical protein